jgi:glutathione S-transferase
MIELYHHGSSVAAAKVRFVLEEKRLPWTGHYVDLLRGEQFDPRYLAVNPRAMVPALRHDGHTIVESTVICEYLEEVFPQPALYPDTPVLRAEARLWTKAVDEELHPACSAITYIVSHRHAIRRHGAQKFEDFLTAPSSESVEARKLKWQWIEHGLAAPGAADKIRLYHRYLRRMEEALAAGDWLVGGRFGIADIALAPYVNRLAMLGMRALWEGGRLPRLAAWFARIEARPAFQAALVKWLPEELARDFRTNGAAAWPEIERIIAAA